jgi:hypothetical protein
MGIYFIMGSKFDVLLLELEVRSVESLPVVKNKIVFVEDSVGSRLIPLLRVRPSCYFM